MRSNRDQTIMKLQKKISWGLSSFSCPAYLFFPKGLWLRWFFWAIFLPFNWRIKISHSRSDQRRRSFTIGLLAISFSSFMGLEWMLRHDWFKMIPGKHLKEFQQWVKFSGIKELHKSWNSLWIGFNNLSIHTEIMQKCKNANCETHQTRQI